MASMPQQRSPAPDRGDATGASRARLATFTPAGCVELFVVANLAFLSLDIYLAHSVNHFRDPLEWLPLGFSIAGSVLMIFAWAARAYLDDSAVSRWTGLLVGWVSVGIGVGGLLLHLNSQFFVQQTLKSLVYTAPFAAPLAYTGLGLLMILNRMVEPDSPQWAGWVLLLTVGGFVGNAVLSLADHAENGFFNWLEWVPVGAALFGVTFLAMPLILEVGREYLQVCWVVLLIEAATGVIGFLLHLRADISRGSGPSWNDFLFGAPVFAPLLFANLAVLGAIALWAMNRIARQTGASQSRAPAVD
jgi:hypothetical protein